MRNLFEKNQKKDVAAISTIKHWISEIFNLTKNDTILVTELQCHEEGCPPIETVIVVMREGARKEQYKFHKQIHEINIEDITDLSSR